ncbi:hypothetical protein WJ22_21860 [Burkholderia vietnamiensis]|nr:Outer membrane component of tripartite multidrug resistance system [Burkholderia sp. KJ006]KVF80542.1 hypothetical protein WJ18_12490 [Burkholderia vietnamiensis]KVF85727.1 hypothetical protein WJ19_15845 [Burkholderia vietnamiensis]KVF94347.1 hypothetical protein WJ20_04460 [Burkholderia vietnamiensis]KVF98303.1 hypothetical protein WJ22_21860 [Burkholderia vietnamiensis]
MLDAERQWSEGRQQAVQGALQTTTDFVALYKALGGGWQTSGTVAAAKMGDAAPSDAAPSDAASPSRAATSAAFQ